MEKPSTRKELPTKLDWITLREELDSLDPETTSSKFGRKFKENPFIPIGCALTVAALTYGLYCFKKGDSRMQQIMMRSRVIAQGFTITAFVVGIGLAAYKT